MLICVLSFCFVFWLLVWKLCTLFLFCDDCPESIHVTVLKSIGSSSILILFEDNTKFVGHLVKTVSFCAYGLFSVFQFCSASVSVSRWYLFNFIRILMISCFSFLLASYTFPLVRLAFFNYFFPLAVTSLRFDLCENIFISLSEGSVASGFLPLR